MTIKILVNGVSKLVWIVSSDIVLEKTKNQFTSI